ncbi:hypothetical protein ES708_28940 [subsurface metagenome]
MKRILIIMSLAVLLVMPLILVGCGGGTTLTESDKATILGYAKRLDDHDSAIGKINNTLGALDTETLGKLAALDAAELTALLDLDLDTALTDIEQLKTDVIDINDPDKADSLADIVTRVGELENGGTNNGGTATSGEITVTLDGEVPFEVYTDKEMTSPYRFSVTIANGTEGWKEVRYCVNFTCTSVDGNAVVDTASIELTASSSSFGGGEVNFAAVCVPAEGKTWQVIFTPLNIFKVVVSPGKTTTVYHAITLWTTGFELWEVTLTGVTVIKL